MPKSFSQEKAVAAEETQAAIITYDTLMTNEMLTNQLMMSSGPVDILVETLGGPARHCHQSNTRPSYPHSTPYPSH